MPALVNIGDQAGGILFETDVGENNLLEISITDEIIEGTQVSIDAVSRTISESTGLLLNSLSSMTEGQRRALSTVEVEFGVNVTGKGNIYVVKASAAANLKIKLAWDFSGARATA